ncbi:hypothetical protein LCGC14_2761290, partial [marine sediment metagenome]
MQVIILSAGMGIRLKPITNEKPKCLVNVCSKPILQHQIDYFFNDDRIDEIIIVIGYMADLIRNLIKTFYNDDPKIILIENKDFLTTNNMYSLFLTRNYIKNSFLLVNGDVILNPEITNELIKFPPENAIAVDIGQYYKESMKVIQKGDLLIDISKKINKKDALGSSIDFYKFSKKGKDIFFSKMEEIIIKRKNANQWTEVAIQELLNNKTLEMKAFDIKGKAWVEIDNFNDLYEAEIKFNNNISKLKEKKVLLCDSIMRSSYTAYNHYKILKGKNVSKQYFITMIFNHLFFNKIISKEISDLYYCPLLYWNEDFRKKFQKFKQPREVLTNLRDQ